MKTQIVAIAAIAVLGVSGAVTANASVTHHAAGQEPNVRATHIRPPTSNFLYNIQEVREPAICGPVVALVEYWLPITGKAVPHPRIAKRYPSGAVTYAQPGYPWADASSTLYSISRYATGNLRVSTVTAADAIHALGAQPDPSAWRTVLRSALQGIRTACPSLPASVVNGPLPR